jgi:excisionase family DNA binding protein
MGIDRREQGMDTSPSDTQIETNRTQESRYMDKPQLFTPLEAWEYLGRRIGRDTLYGKLHSGELGSIKAGRRFVIPKHALEKFLESYK